MSGGNRLDYFCGNKNVHMKFLKPERRHYDTLGRLALCVYMVKDWGQDMNLGVVSPISHSYAPALVFI